MNIKDLVNAIRQGRKLHGNVALADVIVGSYSRTPHLRDDKTGMYLPSARFLDAAFTYRAGAGSPGEVNRTHPVSINSYAANATNPPDLFGQPVLLDAAAHKIRKYVATEANTTGKVPWGVTVRPFPFQQPTAATAGAPATFGTGSPAANAPVDVMRSGYILTKLGNGSITGAVLGGPVFIWAAASSGNDVQGSFTTTTTAGSVAALNTDWFFYHGVEDSSGIVEISFNV